MYSAMASYVVMLYKCNIQTKESLKAGVKKIKTKLVITDAPADWKHILRYFTCLSSVRSDLLAVVAEGPSRGFSGTLVQVYPAKQRKYWYQS